jgi:hypothetical protein
LSSNDGQVALPYGNAYTGFFTASQAFDAGKMGVDRIGGYAMIGQAPTYWRTEGAGSSLVPGGGLGNKSFHREGFVGQFYFGPHVDLTVVSQHGWDNVWFGQGYGNLVDGVTTQNNVPGTTLPAGAVAPTWNGILLEPHYVVSPQLIFIGRYETIRMSRQSTPGTPSNLGNISNVAIGYRYNPFMNPRAGFAWHNEYNWMHQDGTGPMVGATGLNINTSELLMGFDFDF